MEPVTSKPKSGTSRRPDSASNKQLEVSTIDRQDLEDLDPRHRTAVLEGLRQATDEEFASEQEVAAALDRFGK